MPFARRCHAKISRFTMRAAPLRDFAICIRHAAAARRRTRHADASMPFLLMIFS